MRFYCNSKTMVTPRINLELLRAVLPPSMRGLVEKMLQNPDMDGHVLTVIESVDPTGARRMKVMMDPPPAPITQRLYDAEHELPNSAKFLFEQFVAGTLMATYEPWKIAAIGHVACRTPVVVDVPCDCDMCAELVPPGAELLGQKNSMCTLGFASLPAFLDAWPTPPVQKTDVAQAVQAWESLPSHDMTQPAVRASLPHGSNPDAGVFWVYFPNGSVCPP